MATTNDTLTTLKPLGMCGNSGLAVFRAEAARVLPLLEGDDQWATAARRREQCLENVWGNLGRMDREQGLTGDWDTLCAPTRELAHRTADRHLAAWATVKTAAEARALADSSIWLWTIWQRTRACLASRLAGGPDYDPAHTCPVCRPAA